MSLQLTSPASYSANSKIVGLDFLAQKTTWRRRAGLKIVHAHGCWDLLHPGHVRHLKSARDMGDMLVVTVTADQFVNKGPARPVYSDVQRAEMLAALEYVDYVAINHAPDAVEAITRIQPSVYVKGKDYQNANGKIADERAAVELTGGELVCTDDELMSSSELINRHLNGFDPHVREHLDSLRPHLSDILALIESVKDYRVLVVGDAIIDEYQYVQPIGKPPKESVIATRYQETEIFAGGVFAAANHLASFVKEVDVVTCIGDDDPARWPKKARPHKNVNGIVARRKRSPTTRKTRWVDRASMRKLFEVYHMDDSPLPDELQKQLAIPLGTAGSYDLVIVCDFGHGLIGPAQIELLTGRARFLAVNTQTNSGNYGYNLIKRYPAADYVCVDEPEARLAVSDRFAPITEIASRLGAYKKVLITQGKNGSYAYGRGDHHCPPLAKTVVDTVGAGDAVFAITAPLVKAEGRMEHIGFIGNVVGAMAVGIVGNRSSVEKTDLVRSITALLK